MKNTEYQYCEQAIESYHDQITERCIDGQLTFTNGKRYHGSSTNGKRKLRKRNCGKGGSYPMNNDNKRDLTADLAVCEAATPGPWDACLNGDCSCGYIFGLDGEVYVAKAIGRCDDVDPYPNPEVQRNNARFIADARVGWPHAIQRAMKAEVEVERLRAELAKMRRVIRARVQKEVIDSLKGDRRRREIERRFCELTGQEVPRYGDTESED